jgi:hypothetical protein
MNLLQALKSSDAKTQDDAFTVLKQRVYPIAHRRLFCSFPHWVDEAVIEAMGNIFDQVDDIKSEEALEMIGKRAAISSAGSFWQELMARKRGGIKVGSTDELREEPGNSFLTSDQAPTSQVGEAVAVPHLADFELSQMRKLAAQRERRIAGESETPSWSWRWVWGFAAATVIAIFFLFTLPARKTTVQFGMLDSTATRRGETNDVTLALETALQENFGQANLRRCSGRQELDQWLNQWPPGKGLKLLYDRDHGEVRILSRVNGSAQVAKTFAATKEADLPAIFKQARATIQQLSKPRLRLQFATAGPH